jgi:hypothetical protein
LAASGLNWTPESVSLTALTWHFKARQGTSPTVLPISESRPWPGCQRRSSGQRKRN